MKRISLRHFTAHVQELSEPVEVSVQIKGSGEIAVLGTWTPTILGPSGGSRQLDELEAEIRHLKAELAARPGQKSGPIISKPAVAVRADARFGRSSPAPKGK